MTALTAVSFPSGTLGAVIVAAVLLVAVGALAWGLLDTFLREKKPELTDTLAPYSVGQLVEPAGGEAAARSATNPTGELLETQLLQRAVARVEELAAEQGILQYLTKKLDQANLPIRPAEALFFYLVAIVVGGALGLIGNIYIAIVCAAAVAAAPWMILDYLAQRRTIQFTSQLPDMLQLLATTLRSGFSILQGLDTVARQLPEPTGEEMRQVVAEARLGRPLVQALDDVAKRVHSDDFDWVVTAIAIQREVGGNLAELLTIVASTMQERERLRREVRTLTAEGRIGAIVISIMPIAIGLFVYAVNPGYLTPMFHSGPGKIGFFGSIGLAIAGIFWLRNIVQIEI